MKEQSLVLDLTVLVLQSPTCRLPDAPSGLRNLASLLCWVGPIPHSIMLTIPSPERKQSSGQRIRNTWGRNEVIIIVGVIHMENENSVVSVGIV